MFSEIVPPFTWLRSLKPYPFSAFAEISFSALDLAAPNIPIFASALHNDWPANPLQPTSIGS